MRIRNPKRTNGVVLYEGPSLLDGAPIAVIATGLTRKSRNPKLGNMIQTWIMRSDIAPNKALRKRLDKSVCGDCRFASGNGCYVSVGRAPLVVWRAYKRKRYPRVTLSEAKTLFANRSVRVGAYGDGAACPVAVWDISLANIASGTGYTHQWRLERAQTLKRYCMASCDSVRDYAEATRMGWRTFRVRSDMQALQSGEIACPASAEMNRKTNCAACRACFGTQAKAKVNIAIVAHGISAAKAIARVESLQ